MPSLGCLEEDLTGSGVEGGPIGFRSQEIQDWGGGTPGAGECSRRGWVPFEHVEFMALGRHPSIVSSIGPESVLMARLPA